MRKELSQPNSPKRADETYSRPHDPKTNTRPPGNGEREPGETERSEEKLLRVVGR